MSKTAFFVLGPVGHVLLLTSWFIFKINQYSDEFIEDWMMIEEGIQN